MMSKVAQGKRTVLDTSVIIAAGSKWVLPYESVADNSAREVVKKVFINHAGIYSEDMVREYTQKLLDKKHPAQRISKLVGLITEVFEQVTIASKECCPSPDDPKDVPFMICAFDGKADVLVSDDGHFLDLKHKCPAFKIASIDEAVWIL